MTQPNARLEHQAHLLTIPERTPPPTRDFDTIAARDEYPQLNRDRRKHVARLRQRIAYLEWRIDQRTTHDADERWFIFVQWDKCEMAAIQWALDVIDEQYRAVEP